MSNEVPEKQPCDTAEHDPTSVAVDGDDDNSDASNSALAKGLSTIISSIIREFDDSAAATSRSQDQLSSTLDRLTGGTILHLLLNITAGLNFDIYSLWCISVPFLCDKNWNWGSIYCLLG